MTETKRGRDPVIRRLLPVLPPLDSLDLASRLRIYGPVVRGRQTELKITNPTRIAGELCFDKASVLTITVEDPHFDLFRNPLLNERLTISLGTAPELRYISGWTMNVGRAIGGYSTAGTTTVLTFWLEGPAAAKSKTGAKSWPAAKMNFEAWVRALTDEFRDDGALEAVVPRPNSTPPRDTDTDQKSDGVSGSDGSSGSLGWSTATAGKVTVKGVKATPEQLRVIDEGLRAAVAAKTPALAAWSEICAGTQESGCMNLKGGDRDSEGWLQVRVGIHGAEVANSVTKSAEKYFGEGFWVHGGAIKIARENPRLTPGAVAQRVQGSAFPKEYDKHAGEARRTIELWAGVTLEQWHTVTGPAGTSDPRDEASSSNERPTSWRRDKDESTWTALGRTCEGLGRRRFVSAGRLVAARDQDLILAAPHMVLKSLDPSLEPVLTERPTIDIRGNANLTALSLRVVGSGWTAPPGGVVDVRNAGPRATKAWLVQRIAFVAGDPEIDVDLQQPTTKIPSGGGQQSTTSTGVEEGAAAAIKWAEQRVGWKEQPPGSNDGPQVGALIREQGGSPGQPWCGYFCRGALRAAGLDAPAGMAGVAWITSTARAKASVFRGLGRPAQARAGDLALFGSGTHVELIVSVNVSRQEINTIGGNASNQVMRRTHPFSGVTAIAQVDYAKASSAARQTTAVTTT